jgi:hypothetical protein
MENASANSGRQDADLYGWQDARRYGFIRVHLRPSVVKIFPP